MVQGAAHCVPLATHTHVDEQGMGKASRVHRMRVHYVWGTLQAKSQREDRRRCTLYLGYTTGRWSKVGWYVRYTRYRH